MPAFGVTPTGFTRPTLEELLAQLEADQRAEISQTLDLSPDSILGKYNRTLALRLADAWQALQAVHDGSDPDQAVADALTSIAKITGTDREGPSKSLLVGDAGVIVTLAAGTTLEAGVHFAHVTGRPDARFTPRADFTAPADGDYQRDFESEFTGAFQAPAGTLTVIATPVVGWSGVVNLLDASPGRILDDDADLRVRREQGLQRAGSSTVDSLRADVLAVKNVTSCQVFENYGDTVDAQGLPPKSFQVVLFDDAGADDDAIAQAIWKGKAGGIEPIGAESGTALDENGAPHTVAFSRATTVAIYVTATITPRDGYVGDEAFKLALATTLDTQLSTGAAVSTWDVSDAAHGLGAKVSQIKIGTAPSPTSAVDIQIGATQIARFDTSRITLT